jgi:hypothetical protein
LEYKDAFIFVSSCLALDEEVNKKLVYSQISSSKFDWEKIVKLSTRQLVFPAIYFNLKKYNFLELVPNDLVSYMSYVSNLNLERNKSVIKQAKKINELLKKNEINPIFLKGVSHLLVGLYDDESQRMIGDIDFLVSKEQYSLTIKILKESGYKKLHKDKIDFADARHYPRLVKDDEIAAIEVHDELLRPNRLGVFDYNIIKEDLLIEDGFTHLSIQNQIKYNILTNQINDYGLLLNTFSLRKAYDVLLLSSTLNKELDLTQNGKKFSKILKNYLVLCYKIFNEPKVMRFDSKEFNKKKLNSSLKKIYGLSNRRLNDFFIKIYLYLRIRVKIVLVSFVNINYRTWLFKNLLKKMQFLKR